MNLWIAEVAGDGSDGSSRAGNRRCGSDQTQRIAEATSTGNCARLRRRAAETDCIRRRRGNVVAEVGEERIVEHSITATQHGLVVSEDRLQELRRVGKAETGCEVVTVVLDFLAKQQRIRSEGRTIDRRVLQAVQCVKRLILVTKTVVHGQVRLKLPAILEVVRLLVCADVLQRVAKGLRERSGRSAEVIQVVLQVRAIRRGIRQSRAGAARRDVQ